MIRSLLAAGAAATVLVCAQPASASDPRLATRPYAQSEVVRVDGKVGVQASIAFDPDEHIENVAIGDSNSWQVTPNKRANMLFVKPLATRARTNMTVVTDRHDYYFDLVAAPGSTPLYVLRFTYPNDPKPARAAADPALTGDEAALAMGADGPPPVDPADLNFKWGRKGAKALMPARIYDDGSSTYLSWSAGAPVPAILVRGEKDQEGPVNYAVRGDMIVIDGVPGAIVLRSGKDVAVLDNQAPRKPARARTALAIGAAPAASIEERR